MKHLLIAALWLTTTPYYRSSMGQGASLDLFGTTDITSSVFAETGAGFISAGDFKDRHGVANIGYRITPRLNVLVGGGYDRYDLYGAGPTMTRDVHVTFKFKLY